ncbi:MAG TPA: class IV adenylate cyclase [Candidatus Absconditabacterales bacterium]|nr:class IV adenylate cyclase [Candidatus Absconditabacterales bacterium]HMT26697.1 class IV adenylate cyclase [Candidatus Absconditabacterales bacterium]
MNELEVKILKIDKDAMIAKVESFGAQKIFDDTIVADFYKNADGKKLRFRKYGAENILTYKEKIQTETLMENLEYEVVIDDYETFEKMLVALGFVKYGHSSKHRTVYKLGNIVFDFDKYENIPWFVEVESDNEQDLVKGVALLGYTMNDTHTLTESQVKKHYGVE